MSKKVKKDNKKKKAHFNVMDALIILLVIAIGVGIFFRGRIVEKIWAQTSSASYAVSFSIEDIKYTTPNYIDVGDKVYFADNGELLGEFMSESDNVNALNITPASKYFYDSNGNVVEVFYPDGESRVDAKGRILCEGYYNSDGGFSVDGRHYLAPGQSISIKTELVSVTINIMSIDLIEE